MSNPETLREKAAQCRRLARKPRKGFPRAGGHNYLLDLADRFDAEATTLERRMAGGKPGSSPKDEAPSAGTPEEPEGSSAAGTREPSRAS